MRIRVSLQFAFGIVGLSLAFFSCAHSKPLPVHSPKLVLISVDGMRPDFYTRAEYQKVAPTLTRLAREGERAEYGITPVFPSMTYPNHAAMVTGDYPSQNGVVHNKIFSSDQSQPERWFWEESWIRVPTLWQVAEKAGLKVALIRWPVSVGAKVHGNVPDLFGLGQTVDLQRDWELIRQNSIPESLRHVLDSYNVPGNFSDLDQVDTQAAIYLLKNEMPDVLLLHLLEADHVQHEVGIDSPKVLEALHRVDSRLKSVIELLDPSKTTVIVTGDHGFVSYRARIHLKALIHSAKLHVLGQAGGGSAVIYPEPGKPGSDRACLALAHEARKNGVNSVRAIDRKRLTALHAFPDALCALEAGVGVAFDQGNSTPVVEKLDHPRGEHGYLPNRAEMRAGFLIWGEKVSHPGGTIAGDGREKTTLHMVDIAPTAAEMLGLSFSAAGRAMRF